MPVDYSLPTETPFATTFPWMLGEELRKARIAAGLTQEQLAFAAQIDRSYISQLERNKKSPTVEMLLRICAALKVKASRIIEAIEP
jgi:transcriptional regulator with XRE-family HTH domain